MEGRIIKAIAGFYYVHNGEEAYECRARGIFRNKGIKPLVGDIVEIEVLSDEDKKGNLIEIKERKSFLIRPAVANPDQALIVFAGAKPAPNLNLLDKFLTMMEIKRIPVAIAISKSDLVDEAKLTELREIYSPHYKVIEISVKEELGLDEAGQSAARCGQRGQLVQQVAGGNEGEVDDDECEALGRRAAIGQPGIDDEEVVDIGLGLEQGTGLGQAGGVVHRTDQALKHGNGAQCADRVVIKQQAALVEERGFRRVCRAVRVRCGDLGQYQWQPYFDAGAVCVSW